MNDFLMLSMVAMLMIISPGPDFAIVMKNSLSNGRLSGLCTSLGIGLANLCHVTINLLGVGIIIAQSPVIFKFMKILGAIYLIYLGYQGVRAKTGAGKDNPAANLVLENDKKWNGFCSGFLNSLLNPKACLFYLSFFSVILSPKNSASTKVFYGLWLSTLALFWFALVSLFFSNPLIGRKIHSSKHWLERFTGVVLILFGLKLLSSDISSSY